MPSRFRQMCRHVVARGLARWLPRGIMRDERFFDLWQRHGYHVMPLSFYNPIPDTRTLSEAHFERVSELVGIDLRDHAQVQLYRELCRRYRDEVAALPDDLRLGIDWFVLYGMVRRLKPRRVIEIGSGLSTRLTAQALLRNADEENKSPDFTAIEPYPDAALRRGFPGLDRLLESPVQEVPLSTFEALGPNDLLFIDSSHMLKIGSDVQYEFLEIFPRLRVGVTVHVHDIFFPFDYGRRFIKEKKAFWNEQYILQAFMTFNRCFQVDWCSSYMAHHHADVLAEAGEGIVAAQKHPGSFWMQRVASASS